MNKFYIGQAVKYTGDSRFKSPCMGCIGEVIDVGAAGTDYLVKFPMDSVNTTFALEDEGNTFWYNWRELEPVEEEDEAWI